jgi:hypothetical protein
MGGGTYIGRFENILNDLDFVFTDTFIPGTQNTPPTNARAYYVGTNFTGELSSLTQVVGSGIPTSPGSFQVVTINEIDDYIASSNITIINPFLF